MAELIFKRIKDYEFVIWDWNGTLISDTDIAARAESELFKRYGLKIQTPEERAANFCFPIEKYYQKMGFDFAKYSYDAVSREWLEIYEDLVRHVPLFDGVLKMLEDLSKLGRRQFVLSAAPQDHVRRLVLHHGIHDYFEAVYALPNAKAESKIQRGRELVADFDIDVTRAILIGDTAHDYEVASALGCDSLLVADGHHAYDALVKVHHNVLPTRFEKKI